MARISNTTSTCARLGATCSFRNARPPPGLAALAAIALAGLLGACSTGTTGGGTPFPDTGPIYIGPDAPQGIPPGFPDAARTPRPDAGARPLADAAGGGMPDAGGSNNNCSPTFQNLLKNGNFDMGPSGSWKEAGSPSNIIKQPSGFSAQSGSYVAWMLGVVNASQTLSQTVTIPTGSTQLQLTFYRCFVTQDTSGTADWLKIELQDKGGGVIKTLKTFTNQDAGATCGWTQETFPISPAMGGQSVALAFTGQEDASGITSFVIDTVALDAACP